MQPHIKRRFFPALSQEGLAAQVAELQQQLEEAQSKARCLDTTALHLLCPFPACGSHSVVQAVGVLKVRKRRHTRLKRGPRGKLTLCSLVFLCVITRWLGWRLRRAMLLHRHRSSVLELGSPPHNDGLHGVKRTGGGEKFWTSRGGFLGRDSDARSCPSAYIHANGTMRQETQ